MALAAFGALRSPATCRCWIACGPCPFLGVAMPRLSGLLLLTSAVSPRCVPQESCDLLVLDRSYDAVAPFIHEWSYEALAYDLVPIEGNVYK